MAKNKYGLTIKQELFCQNYIISSNGTQSAIKAGYSKNSAGEIGVENLTKPLIKKRLAQLRKPIAEKLELTKDMVLREIKNLAFSNLADFFDEDGYLKQINELTRDQTASLSSVDFQYFIKDEEGQPARLHISQASKLKFWNKPNSLKMLGDSMNLFNQPPGDEDTDQEMEDKWL